MALKEYRCFRWPELRVGSSIKFTDGAYRTEDEGEQALIESLSYYGPLVWEEKDPPTDVVPLEESPATVNSTTTTQARGKWRVKQ